MFETISIALGESIGESIINDHQQFSIVLQPHLPTITELLKNHWYRKRGTISNVSIAQDSAHFTDPTKGYFFVLYQLTFTFACEDITHDHQERMKITFSFSADLKTLTLESEPEPDRLDEL